MDARSGVRSGLTEENSMARIIMHIDMDCYFASVEQQAWPPYRGRPIGVTGKPQETTIVVAASREAKKHGVKTAMPVWEARRVCRSLLLVPGCAERYIETTNRFVGILKRFTPQLEVYSIDEVFMDITQEAARYGGPVPLARRIKQEFRAALGEHITATIGIAPNRAFSKLIAKRNKPDGIGILSSSEIPDLLSKTPVTDICGVGSRIDNRLRRMAIRTLADLGECPRTLLQREFGVYGNFLKEIGQGRDPTPLVSYWEVPPPKSVGHSKTLPPDLRDMSLASIVLRELCERVGRRMRKLGYLGRTVHFWFGSEVTGRGHGKQTTLARPTADGATIYEACQSILDRMPIHPSSVAVIGVSVSNLVDKRGVTISILEEDHRRDRLNNAVDRIRDRFGEDSIRFASAVLPRAIPEHIGGFTGTASFEF
jgi:DNA polymerase-4